MNFSSSFLAQVRNWIYMLKTVKGNVSLSTLFFLMPDMTQMVRYNYFSLVFLIQSMVQRTKNIFVEPYKHRDDFYEVVEFENYPYLSKVWSLLWEGLIISPRVAGVPCRGRKTGEIGTGEFWGTSKKDWIKYRLFILLINVEINLEIKRLMGILFTWNISKY